LWAKRAGEDVGDREEFVERRSAFGFAGGGDVGIEGDGAHPERVRQARDAGADVAVSDDAEDVLKAARG
jgi:hypothetical protein